MSDSLTQEQKEQIVNRINYWQNNSLEAKPIDMSELEEFIEYLYINIFNFKRVPEIIVEENPFEAWRTYRQVNGYPYEINYTLYSLFTDSVVKFGNRFSKRNTNNGMKEIAASLESEILRNKPDSLIRVKGLVEEEIKKINKDFIFPTFPGLLELHYFLVFRDCLVEILGKYPYKKGEEKLLLYMNFGPIYNGVRYCVVSDRLKTYKTNSMGAIHNDNGPAISYGGGIDIYFLNGVKVPKYVVTTPPDQFDLQKILGSVNAEVRREIVRKVGIERMFKQLPIAIISKRGNYELLSINIGDGRKRPFLKMVNPSTGDYHIEGVHPTIGTVEEALAWRNGVDTLPLILT